MRELRKVLIKVLEFNFVCSHMVMRMCNRPPDVRSRARANLFPLIHRSSSRICVQTYIHWAASIWSYSQSDCTIVPIPPQHVRTLPPHNYLFLTPQVCDYKKYYCNTECHHSITYFDTPGLPQHSFYSVCHSVAYKKRVVKTRRSHWQEFVLSTTKKRRGQQQKWDVFSVSL